MKNKNKFFSLIVLSILALVISGGFVSATDCLTLAEVTVPEDVDHDQGFFEVEFRLSYTGSCTLPRTGIEWVFFSNIDEMTWTAPTQSGLGFGESKLLKVPFTFPAHHSGDISISVMVTSAEGDADTLALTPIEINNAPSIKITETQVITQTQDGVIEVENDGNINWADVELSSSTEDFEVEFSDDEFNLPAGEKKTITVSPVDLGTVGFGGEYVVITATSNDGTTDSITMNIEGSFCEVGEIGGRLEITNIEINNKDGDDNEWFLLDVIKIDVEVENTANDDVDDVMIELGFFDSEGVNQVNDFEFDNADEEEFDVGKIRDGKEETVTFNFRVPADFEEGDYKLTIKAYSKDLGEDVECVDTSRDHDGVGDLFTNIDIQREDDEGKFIAFDNIEFTPVEGTCGDRITITLDVFNVGDEDLEDRIKVKLKNTELGIDEFFEIISNLDQGDKETASFDFVIPQNARDDSYTLRLSSEYDYNRGNYRQGSDVDEVVSFRVIGCGSPVGEKVADISAVLDSDEPMAREELIVRATITNLKSDRASFAIDAFGYQSWASLDELSPRIVDLAAGASEDVVLTFTLDEDACGEESFDVEVRDSSGMIETREIGVNIGCTSQPSVGFDLGDNSFLWIVGIINVVLVVLIIVVAVRVARR